MSTIGRICRLGRRNNWLRPTSTRSFLGIPLPQSLQSISQSLQPPPIDVARKALEVEATRAPLERDARIEELVERIQNLAHEKAAGNKIDESEVDSLESEFKILKSQPEIDREQFINERLAEWERNPEARAQYVHEIEERRALYSKFAVNKGEPEIQEFSKLTSGYNMVDSGLPSDYISRVSSPNANDPSYYTPGMDMAAQTGIYWDVYPEDEVERREALPPPETDEFVPITFVAANNKVYKDCKAYIGESLTTTAIRNKVPIQASCSDGTEVQSIIDHGLDVGCNTCQMRLEPSMYKQVCPPVGTELIHLKGTISGAGEMDRLGCLVRIKKTMANSRVYVCPSM